jgi:hypothetical protein
MTIPINQTARRHVPEDRKLQISTPNLITMTFFSGVRGTEVSRGSVSSRHELRRQVSQCVSDQKKSAAIAGNGLPSAQLQAPAAPRPCYGGSSLLHRQQHIHR